MIRKVLVVCSGNTCRSPMAAALLLAEIARHSDIRTLGIDVRSAGAACSPGDSATPEAIAALQRYGIDLRSHHATPLTADLVDWADLILPMSNGHRRAILNLRPEARDRTHLIREYSGSGGAVDDPYGQSQAVYDACADDLLQIVRAVVVQLRATPSSRAPVPGT